MRGELQLVYSALHLFKLHSAGCRRIRLRGGGLTTDGNIRQRYFQQLKTSIDVPVVFF